MIQTTLALVALLCAQDAGWPRWLGPNRDNQSTEKGLLKEWPAGGPAQVWKSEIVGEGFGTVAVTGGKVYLLGDLEDASYLLCLNEADGKLAWKAKIGPARVHGNKGWCGPRATPSVVGPQIIVLGEAGDLVSVETATGKERWRKHMQKDLNGSVGDWLWSESPLVDGKNIICIPGGKDGAVAALSLDKGEVLWRCKEFTDAAEYTSVVEAELGGVKQYVALTMKNVVGIAKDGKLLWKAPREEGKVAVCTTPVVRDGIVFVTSSYGIGCTAFSVTGSGGQFKAERIYEGKQMTNHHGGVILLGEHLYGLTDGPMECVEFKTGKSVWKDRSVGKGAITYADGHFIVRSENAKRGDIALVEATPVGYKEKGRFSLPDATGRNTWAYPVVANGRLYIRNQNVLYAFDVKAK
jgi:outer membrane protein assembly factor BamB